MILLIKWLLEYYRKQLTTELDTAVDVYNKYVTSKDFQKIDAPQSNSVLKNHVCIPINIQKLAIYGEKAFRNKGSEVSVPRPR